MWEGEHRGIVTGLRLMLRVWCEIWWNENVVKSFDAQDECSVVYILMIFLEIMWGVKMPRRWILKGERLADAQCGDDQDKGEADVEGGGVGIGRVT